MLAIPQIRAFALVSLLAALAAIGALACTQAAGAGANATPTAVWEFTVVPVGTPVPTPTPTPVPGAVLGVAQLATRWPLAIVSDAVFSPGRCLREILRTHHLLDYFQTCIFSDEAGRSKPHKDVFTAAANGLGVPLDAMVHVGDRDHHDIRGAQAAGMKAVLCVAARDKDLAGTAADAVCGNWEELPSIISSL